MFPLTEQSVLDYFSMSQFYDRTCNNEQLRMQTRFTGPADQTTFNRHLEEMVGIEYSVALAQPPKLFLIHKRHRHSPTDAELLASFYILDGSIYMSPDLLSILSTRLTTSMSYLKQSMDLGHRWLQYHPNEKAYKVIQEQITGERGVEGEVGDLMEVRVQDQTALSFHAILSSRQNQNKT